MIRRKISVALIALSLAGATHAADEPAREAARQHFGRGLELARSGRYEQALGEFLAAYRDRPHYAALYNIGQAYIELGRSVDAIAALERYLEDGKNQVAFERAEQVRLQIAAEKARTAELIVSVNAPGASIAMDGVPVGTAPRVGPLRVSTGAHDVALSIAGVPGMHRSVVLVAGQTLELAFPDAAPAAPAAAPVTPLASATHAVPFARDAAIPRADVADPGTSDASATLALVLGGVGLSLGGIAFGHYLWNRERYHRWQAENRALGAEPGTGAAHRERQIESNRLAASIERASRWTVALSVAGGAFFASGATLLVIHESAPASVAGESATVFLLQGMW
jgi:hypothetical protein